MKKKSKASSPFVYAHSLYCSKNLKKHANTSSLALYAVVLLLVLALINLLKAAVGVSLTGVVQSFMYTLIGIPLITITFFVLFYIFLVALENKNKTFWESYFAFLALALPYFIIGHLLNWVRGTTYNEIIEIVISLLILIMIIYFIVMFVRSFSNYFKTNGYRVLASSLMAFIVIGIFGIMNYLALLISSLA